MRKRNVAGAVLAIMAVSGSCSIAADAPPSPLAPVSTVLGAISGTPDGWTRNLDGSYKHAASGVLCPVEFKSFHFDSLDGPSKDNAVVQGICRYKDGAGRVGIVRVRQPGDTSDAATAANDKALMATDGSAPPMLMRASVDRKSGGSRLTVTILRSGFLVDCSVVQLEHNIPSGDFPLYCTTIPGGK